MATQEPIKCHDCEHMYRYAYDLKCHRNITEEMRKERKEAGREGVVWLDL